jgi:hypothetical protein
LLDSVEGYRYDLCFTIAIPSYDCSQLASESQRVQSRYLKLGGRLDTAARNDAPLVGVGVILFWPALFALGGTKQQDAEYGRLRGDYDSIQQTSIQKKCGAAPASVAVPAALLAQAPTAAPAASASASI